jgi:hypothetical protein
MWVFLIEQEGQLFGDLKGLDPENAVIKWRKEKADVEKFIIRGEMYEALHKAWHMVEMFHEVLPNESREIAHWCLSAAEKLLDIRAEASMELASLMSCVRNGLPIIEELKVPVTPKLAQKIYPGYELKFLPTKAE